MSAMPLRLFDATDALLEVKVWVEEHAEELIAAGGDLDALPELRELIELAEGDFATKAERVALYIRELLATAGARKEESKRLGALATTDEKAAEGLKRYLCRELRRAGVPQVSGKLIKIGVQRNSAVSTTLDEPKALAWVMSESDDLDDGGPWDDYDAARELVTVKQVTTVTLNRPAVVARWQKRYTETLAQLRADQPDGSEESLDRFAQAIANEDPLFVQLGIRVEHGFHVRLR